MPESDGDDPVGGAVKREPEPEDPMGIPPPPGHVNLAADEDTSEAPQPQATALPESGSETEVEPPSSRLRDRSGLAVYNEDTLAAIQMGEEHVKGESSPEPSNQPEPEDMGSDEEEDAPIFDFAPDQPDPPLAPESVEAETESEEDPGPLLRGPMTKPTEAESKGVGYALGVAFLLATVAAVLN
jgi:hypothetical protein